MEIIEKTFKEVRKEFYEKIDLAKDEKEKLDISMKYINYLEKKTIINNFNSFFVSYDITVKKGDIEEVYECNAQISFNDMIINEDGYFDLGDKFHEVLKEHSDLDFYSEYECLYINIISISKI